MAMPYTEACQHRYLCLSCGGAILPGMTAIVIPARRGRSRRMHASKATCRAELKALLDPPGVKSELFAKHRA